MNQGYDMLSTKVLACGYSKDNRKYDWNEYKYDNNRNENRKIAIAISFIWVIANEIVNHERHHEQVCYNG